VLGQGGARRGRLLGGPGADRVGLDGGDGQRDLATGGAARCAAELVAVAGLDPGDEPVELGGQRDQGRMSGHRRSW
jgi:hypothetical protein